MAVFVDTSAWFAYFVRRDPDHRAAIAWMRRNREPLVTTDYILDELLTLLKMRENYRVAVAAGEALWQQRVTRIEHVTVEDITRTWEVFRQYHDKDWSFTDCTSKVIIPDFRGAKSTHIPHGKPQCFQGTRMLFVRGFSA